MMFSSNLRFPAAGIFILAAAAFAVAQEDSGAGDAPAVFALDSLTVESARAQDSLRRAAEEARANANAGVEPDAAAEIGDYGAALAGTAEGKGSLSGRVVSEARGTVISGARVIVAGRNLSAVTDADGRFGFPDLDVGPYTLFVYHGSYAPLTTDTLAVVADRDLRARLLLPDKALQGETVRITGTAATASEAGLLFAQRNAPSVRDGISSEQISKTPDGDAAAALRRVTGISVAGDGLVYVRGLGERYVNMQLNGLNISSPNPEKRVIPLDMFPTRLLENLVVSKTFTADQPAEFAGGSLQLRTKDYPDQRLIEFSAGAGYDPGASFGKYLTYRGGAWDWLGVDDGTRARPGNVPAEFFDHRTPNLGATPEERQARQREILSALPNVWTPYEAAAPLNQSYGLSMGNKIPLGGERVFGWLAGASYSRSFSIDEEFTGRINVDNDGENASYRDRYVSDVHAENVKWGTLGTATLQDGDLHKLRLNFLLTRDWEDEVKSIVGRREQDGDTSLVYEIATAHQMLRNAQLEGEHRLDRDGTRLRWMTALTGAERSEPDRRVSKYFLMRPDDSLYNPDFPWYVAATLGLQDRYWFELEETGWGGKVEIETPFEKGFLREGSRASGGAFLFGKGRDYTVRRLSYYPGSAIQQAPERFGGTYEDYFGLLNGAADSGYVSNRTQKQKDSYSVEDFQWAAHVQGDMVLSDAWRAIAGMRLVNARVEGTSRSPQGELSPSEAEAATCDQGDCVIPFGYDRTALLPALSLVYAATESQNLRASWTRTFSYPEYREMSPALFFSYQDALETVGNVELEPTDIQNYDLRWEWFLSASELMAVSAFYKNFEDPVEIRIRPGASNSRATFINAPSADLLGAEWELRAGLERVHEMLLPFQIVGNFTWIRSEVEGERRRAMQGQSPYLVNAILFFEPEGTGARMSLLYNKFGRRIAKVGVPPFPDVYEEARASLEFSWSQTLSGGLKAKFTARDLTSAEKIETQGGLVVRRVAGEPTYSLGVTYAF